MIPAILGVGSWWAYKFWPRKKMPDDVGVLTFLERLEQPPKVETDARKGADTDSPMEPPDALEGLRL